MKKETELVAVVTEVVDPYTDHVFAEPGDLIILKTWFDNKTSVEFLCTSCSRERTETSLLMRNNPIYHRHFVGKYSVLGEL